MTKIISVDENDNIIGLVDRDDNNPDTITRVAGLWVFNSKKRF